jgi:16S rRNA (uracil1498-N3)-methyltransferase
LPALITIFQALTKSKSMDWIIQKATELGAHRIVPITAARSVVHIEPGDAAQRVEKWMASAVEAAKQCGSAWLPRLELPLSLRQAIDRGKSCELKLVASLQTGANHARRCFDQFHAAHGRPPASVAVWVGPEGDFAPEEIELLLRAGVLPFTLGTLTLRSETAAVAALAIVNHETRPA